MSMMLAEERRKRVIGIASTGRFIFAISGSEGEEEGSGNNGENDEGGSGGEGGSGSSGSGTTTVTEQPKTVTAEEHDTILRRLQAADKAKGEFEKKLREIEDKDKSEVEKLKRDFEELKKERDQAVQEALSAKLSSEILKFPGFVWHDPEAVLRLVDMEMISVDNETGKVNGVRDALNKLAKDKAYLLKSKANEGGGKNGSGGNGSSGHNPSGGGDTSDKNKQREKLVSKYKL